MTTHWYRRCTLDFPENVRDVEEALSPFIDGYGLGWGTVTVGDVGAGLPEEAGDFMNNPGLLRLG